jgi:hypothetical protein
VTTFSCSFTSLFSLQNPCGKPKSQHFYYIPWSNWQAVSLLLSASHLLCLFRRWQTEGNSTKEQTVCSYRQTPKSNSPHKKRRIKKTKLTWRLQYWKQLKSVSIVGKLENKLQCCIHLLEHNK